MPRRWHRARPLGRALPRAVGRLQRRHLRLRLWWDEPGEAGVAHARRPAAARALGRAQQLAADQGVTPRAAAAPRTHAAAPRASAAAPRGDAAGAPERATTVAGRWVRRARAASSAAVHPQLPSSREARGTAPTAAAPLGSPAAASSTEPVAPSARFGALAMRDGLPRAAARPAAAARRGRALLQRVAEAADRIDAAASRAAGTPAGALLARLHPLDSGDAAPVAARPAGARSPAHPHARRAAPGTHAPPALAGDPARGATLAGRVPQRVTGVPLPGPAPGTAPRARDDSPAAPRPGNALAGERQRAAFLPRVGPRQPLRSHVRQRALSETPRANRAAPAPSPGTAPIQLEPSVGSPLPPGLRARLESRLGDLGAVRVHTGESAGRAARAMRAAAFTVGRNVFFAPGRFDPDSEAGVGLLAHELAHFTPPPTGRPFGAAELTPAAQELLEARAGAGQTIVPAARVDAARPLVWAPLSLALAPAGGAASVPMLAPETTPMPPTAGVAGAAPGATPARGGTTATTGTNAAAPGAAATGAPADTGELVDEVLRRLAQRTRLDAERGGIQPWL